jgi:hypothetical protein
MLYRCINFYIVSSVNYIYTHLYCTVRDRVPNPGKQIREPETSCKPLTYRMGIWGGQRSDHETDHTSI